MITIKEFVENYNSFPIFHSEQMTDAVRNFIKPELLGLSLFKKTPMKSRTAKWAEISGNRTLAPWHPGRGEAKQMSPIGKQKFSLEMGRIRVKKELMAETLAWFHDPDKQEDTQYGNQAVLDEMEDLNDTVDRAVEKLIWDAFSGKISVDEEDVQWEVDYDLPSEHKPTPLVLWDNADADIMGNVKAWTQLGARDSGYPMINMYCNSTVTSYMIKNNAIKDWWNVNQRNVVLETGTIKRAFKLDIFEYDQGYEDGSGNFYPYIPDDKCIITIDPKYVGGVQEGPAADLDAGLNPGKFSKTYIQKDPSAVIAIIEYNLMLAIKRKLGIIYATIA